MPAAKLQNEDPPVSSEVKVTSFFDAPFTASSNRLLEALYSDPDVDPRTRLLLFISRFSTGYLKPEAVLKESFILDTTQMSRSSLYKAKNELIDAGLITISHTQTGNCVYRLTSEYQCLKGATSAQEKANHRWGSATADGRGLQPRTPHVYKEIQENLDHHQSTSQPESQPHQETTDDEFLKLECDKERSAPTKSVSRNTGTGVALSLLSSPMTDLTARLQEFSINARIARNLVESNPSDVIERALAGVQARKEIKNPAGWLVREIEAGGYKPPEAIRAAQNRRAVEVCRSAEKIAVEVQRDIQDQAAQADLAELAQLGHERRQELLEAARARLSWLPRVATATSDNPFIRASMLEILREVRLRQ